MKRRCAGIGTVMIAVVIQFRADAQTLTVGTMLGRTFYNKDASAGFDTLGWDMISPTVLGTPAHGAKGPLASCSLLQAAGKSLFQVRDAGSVPEDRFFAMQ